MRSCVLAVLTLSLCQVSWAASLQEGLVGTYTCKGTEYDSSSQFSCQMSIQSSGRTYALKSHCTDGSQYQGTGIYNSSKNLLSVIMVNPKNRKETGVASVEVSQDGSLDSVWTYLDKTTLGSSHCTKADKAS